MPTLANELFFIIRQQDFWAPWPCNKWSFKRAGSWAIFFWSRHYHNSSFIMSHSVTCEMDMTERSLLIYLATEIWSRGELKLFWSSATLCCRNSCNSLLHSLWKQWSWWNSTSGRAAPWYLWTPGMFTSMSLYIQSQGDTFNLSEIEGISVKFPVFLPSSHSKGLQPEFATSGSMNGLLVRLILTETTRLHQFKTGFSSATEATA